MENIYYYIVLDIITYDNDYELLLNVYFTIFQTFKSDF